MIALAFVLFLIANVADAITTNEIIRLGGYEKNPLLGKHPTPGHVWAAKAAVVIASGVFLYVFPQGAIGLIALSAVYGFAAWHNTQVDKGSQ